MTKEVICDILDTLREYVRGELEEYIDGGGNDDKHIHFLEGKMAGLQLAHQHFAKSIIK